MTLPARRIESTDELCRLMGIPFSKQQLDAITAPLAPAVIVAGAGSGKTTVMAARVVWLVGTGQVAPDEVLGLTFTNKAAAELGHRVREFLGKAGLIRVPGTPAGDDDEEPAEPAVLTYHSYAARLLTEHGLRIGHEPDTRVMADASRFQLAERAIRSHAGAIEQVTTSMSYAVRYVLNLDAQLSEHLVSIDEVLRWQAAELPRWRAAKQTQVVVDVQTKFVAREELLRLVADYRALKELRGVMDFSDQMAKTARLTESYPEVGAAERAKFKVVLLDEYQDTSVAQARLLQALFSGPDADHGLGHPVTAVGDPCQAIYGWRGASVSNITGFPHDFPSGEARRPTKRLPLSVNRRSESRILQCANDLATPLYAVHPGVERLSAPPEAGAGTVRAAILETFNDELDFLAREVPLAHAQMREPAWSKIGVLARDNKTAAAVHDALVAVDVPVEVVGLSGLLAMPEIAEVVATLEILHDVTANAALLQILAGPRWAIGVRDLALLGKRAASLSKADRRETQDLSAALEEAVAGVDPADVVSLLEALQSPGGAPYSEEARQRFRQLAIEVSALQRHIGEPLLDLVRRVIDTIGIDVELAAANSRVAVARRDNLSTFLDAVVAFAGVDGDASLSGLLAYLGAEEEYGQGLSLALPTEANSVKLLTIHKAKGLEWDVVFIPGLTKEVFPSSQGQSRWPANAQELPSPLRGDAHDLPELVDYSRQGILDFNQASRQHEQLEELRLGYVAFTRPREVLFASAYWWGPEQKILRGPSGFMATLLGSMATWGAGADESFPKPADGSENPANRKLVAYPWPVRSGGDEIDRRQRAATLVSAAREVGWKAAAASADEALLLDEVARVQQWDLELGRLIEEARVSQADEIIVPLPRTLSATTMLSLQADPHGLARALVRPMPRKPSKAARFGTRFHAWVETFFGQQELLEADDLPGRADEDITGDDDLRALIDAFKAGPFADRVPHQVEASFALVLVGQVVRGRIDAVYETDDGFEVVDWKTNRAETADPLQLAIYRLAWAELLGVPVANVTASFYYVRTGNVVRYADDDLPDRAALEQIITQHA